MALVSVLIDDRFRGGRALPAALVPHGQWVHRLAATAVMATAIAAVAVQQLHRTPWGLPGHRGIFWLSVLIATRWCLDRPGTALRVAAGGSCVILFVDPTMGTHVLPYLAAAMLIDRLAEVPLVREHPWLMLPLAPVIHLVGVLSPFLHHLGGGSGLGTVLGGMWFYIRGHLLWGAGAGVVGMALGLAGRRLMDRSPSAH